MDIQYKKWCFQKLTPTEFVVYEVLLDLGECQVRQSWIADLLSMTSRNVQRLLKRLQDKKFIAFQPYHKLGMEILWVRKSREELAPSFQTLSKDLFVSLRSPQGKLKRIRIGKISRFCRDNGISAGNFYKMLNGEFSQTKGWRLA